jgi:hypothetical protein
MHAINIDRVIMVMISGVGAVYVSPFPNETLHRLYACSEKTGSKRTLALAARSHIHDGHPRSSSAHGELLPGRCERDTIHSTGESRDALDHLRLVRGSSRGGASGVVVRAEDLRLMRATPSRCEPLPIRCPRSGIQQFRTVPTSSSGTSRKWDGVHELAGGEIPTLERVVRTPRTGEDRVTVGREVESVAAD